MYSGLKEKYSSEIDLHLVVQDPRNDYSKELSKLGIPVHYVPDLKRNLFGYVSGWKKIFKAYDIDAIHFQVDNLVLFYPIQLAHKYGIKRIIVQSHNSYNKNVADSKLKSFITNYAQKNIEKWTTKRLAVSTEAGKWLYGEKASFEIIKNPVDIKKFTFNEVTREKLRDEFNFSKDVKVFGNVGRLAEQKNQAFLLNVFKNILEKNGNARLVIVGNGPLKDDLIALAKKLQINDQVSFLGRREDVPELLDCFDCMIFPSLFEGFPLSLLEAQSTGLPVLYSDTISKDIKILPTTEALSLQDNYGKWAEEAIKLADFPVEERKSAAKSMVKAKFDYQTQLDVLAKLYLA